MGDCDRVWFVSLAVRTLTKRRMHCSEPEERETNQAYADKTLSVLLVENLK